MIFMLNVLVANKYWLNLTLELCSCNQPKVFSYQIPPFTMSANIRTIPETYHCVLHIQLLVYNDLISCILLYECLFMGHNNVH